MDNLGILRQEHRLLRDVLDCLERCIQNNPSKPCVNDLSRFVDFLQRYVHAWHNPKEDNILFDVLERHGFSRSAGPIALVNVEHTEVKRHLLSAVCLLNRGHLQTGDNLATLLSTLRSLIYNLRCHLDLEEAIIFPTAEAELPPEALRSISDRLHVRERDALGKLQTNAMRRLGEHLQAAYPPARPKRATPPRPAAPTLPAQVSPPSLAYLAVASAMLPAVQALTPRHDSN